jgi:hypothetical protein
MTQIKSRAMQPPSDRLVEDELLAAANHGSLPALSVLILVAMTLCAWPGSQILAADRIDNDRSVHGSGTTAGPGAEQQNRTSLPSSPNAGSLSDPSQGDARCATLRKRYAQSEACFARYRMKDGGLRPGAFQRCEQLDDPSSECGSGVVP